MCGRYVLKATLRQITDAYGADPNGLYDVRPVYNAAPTFDMPVVFETQTGHRMADAFRWGLIPSWAKNEKVKYSMINARAESLSRKPSYREAYKYRRCVVPASGFYEWQNTPDGKIPFYITLENEKLMSFAGLYEHWTSADGKIVNSFTIVTTAVNETIQPLHDRMPALLFGEVIDAWLDPGNRDTAARG